MDPAGNVKPDKASAAEKIDGISAAAIALRECIDAASAEQAPEPAAAAVPLPAMSGSPWRNQTRLSL
jgi:hypothetical protein